MKEKLYTASKKVVVLLNFQKSGFFFTTKSAGSTINSQQPYAYGLLWHCYSSIPAPTAPFILKGNPVSTETSTIEGDLIATAYSIIEGNPVVTATSTIERDLEESEAEDSISIKGAIGDPGT